MLTQNKQKRSRLHRMDAAMSIMVSPFLILFAVFTLLPIVVSVVLSFTRYDMINMPEFLGLDNYARMFYGDVNFPTALKNTLLLAVVTGPLGFLLSFMLAFLISEYSRGVRTVLSFLFYSPALMGNAYFIWQILFSGDSYGYINSLLISMNIIVEPIQWLRTESTAIWIVVIVQLWMGMGISFLSNVAGLQNIDKQLYEAAAIDGIRNRWAELWYITIPVMKDILLFSSVMQIQSAFSIGAVATALTGFPSVNNSTLTILTHMQDVGTMRFELGYASAISVVLFVMMAFSRILVGKLLNMSGK
ncbi:MAG: sugar ABC transporter permease [Clostridia bacterium]|nr:sugar ABC transporter permease [Clostridia bacterium]